MLDNLPVKAWIDERGRWHTIYESGEHVIRERGKLPIRNAGGPHEDGDLPCKEDEAGSNPVTSSTKKENNEEHSMELPTIKELVKDRQKVYFSWFRDGTLWYKTESGFKFPISGEDLKGATFKAEDRAILYTRWIRKQINYLEECARKAGLV